MLPRHSPGTTASKCRHLSCSNLEPLPDRNFEFCFKMFQVFISLHDLHVIKPSTAADVPTQNGISRTVAPHAAFSASILRQIDCTSSVMLVRTSQSAKPPWAKSFDPQHQHRPSQWNHPRPGKRVEPHHWTHDKSHKTSAMWSIYIQKIANHYLSLSLSLSLYLSLSLSNIIVNLCKLLQHVKY